MKLCQLYIVILLVLPLVAADSEGRSMSRQRREPPFTLQRAYPQSGTVELDLSYDFSFSEETHRISFIVPLPQSVENRQNVLSIHYDPKPSRIFERDGNRYAEFVFIHPEKKVSATIHVRLKLFRYDLLTAMKNHKKSPLEEEGLEDFLRSERFIEKDDDQIQEIAGSIEGRMEVDVVHKIYDYVIDHMEYATPSRRSKGAVIALQRGQGDCTEYADLFVALCRAKDIPARVISGYTVRFDSESPKHNWVEVYLQEYGWVPFDPSAGDIRNTIIRGRSFSRLRPMYIYLSHIRNDEILGDYSFGAYHYWGDKPRFKESIDFNLLFPSIRREN